MICPTKMNKRGLSWLKLFSIWFLISKSDARKEQWKECRMFFTISITEKNVSLNTFWVDDDGEELTARQYRSIKQIINVRIDGSDGNFQSTRLDLTSRIISQTNRFRNETIEIRNSFVFTIDNLLSKACFHVSERRHKRKKKNNKVKNYRTERR